MSRSRPTALAQGVILTEHVGSTSPLPSHGPEQKMRTAESAQQDESESRKPRGVTLGLSARVGVIRGFRPGADDAQFEIQNSGAEELAFRRVSDGLVVRLQPGEWMGIARNEPWVCIDPGPLSHDVDCWCLACCPPGPDPECVAVGCGGCGDKLLFPCNCFDCRWPGSGDSYFDGETEWFRCCFCKKLFLIEDMDCLSGDEQGCHPCTGEWEKRWRAEKPGDAG
jgi:hypothetical protein